MEEEGKKPLVRFEPTTSRLQGVCSITLLQKISSTFQLRLTLDNIEDVEAEYHTIAVSTYTPIHNYASCP